MPTAESRLHLRIPCDAGLHWRAIELLIPFAEDELSLSALSGLTSTSANRWVLAEPEVEAQCHSHARLFNWKSPEGASAGDDAPSTGQLIEIETYRFGLGADDRQDTDISHATFFEALQSAASVDEFFIIANVRLGFPARTSTWQATLLASPPDIAELPGDLGKISLSGLSLRFRDSKLGLLEARLDSSGPDNDYSVDVRFSLSVPSEALPNTYETVLDKAERLANLFVVTTP